MGAALPDALTALLFLWLWFNPAGWREPLVPALVLVMLMEFLLMHAAGALGSVVFDAQRGAHGKVLALLGLGALYALLAAGWMLQFKTLWPVVALGWRVLTKLIALLPGRADTAVAQARQKGLWAISAVGYVLAILLSAVLPLPQGGVTHSLDYYGVPLGRGGGAWADEPHLALAAGVLYFGLLSWVKTFDLGAIFARLPARRR